MVNVSPFGADGDWLRCALHAHTTNSDGELAPEQLVEHYEQAGYDVLCITDHWARTVAPSTERMLVIPGIELNATVDGLPDWGTPGPWGDGVHILGLGVEAEPVEARDGFPPLQETVSWISENGGVPFLAHTHSSGMRVEMFADCEGLVGIEVFNAGCELDHGRGDGAFHWDEALMRGRHLTALATDDSHSPGFDSGHASVYVRAKERSRAAVLEALASGTFYSSLGPRIEDVVAEDDHVLVRCSPCVAAGLLADPGPGLGSRVTAGLDGDWARGIVLDRTPAGEILGARLERTSQMSFGRVEVVDARGRKAWTNPLWVAT